VEGIPVFANKLESIPSSRDVLIDISNIGLVNELFLLESGIRKLNDSMQTWEAAYQDAKRGFMDGKLNLATYVANTRRANETVQVLEKFLQSTQEEIMDATALFVCCFKTSRFLAKLYTGSRLIAMFPRHMLFDRLNYEKLQEEARTIGEESKARIQSVLGANVTARADPAEPR
jgi:hypothetical protein